MVVNSKFLYRAPLENLETMMVSRFFVLPKSGVSLIFGLMKSPDRNRLDKLLHPLCTVLLHLLRNMSVNIQRESRGGMAEIFLHGFNVVAAFDTGNCVCVPQSMEGNASVRCGGVTDGITVAEDELLHAADSSVGGYAIRHQQLVAAFRFLQQPLQHHRDTVVLDGDDTHLTALAFHGEGILTQCLFRCGGVHAEALVDTQAGVTSQIQGEDVVLPLLRHGAADQLAELRVCPCAILLPEAAAFQGNAQFFIAR